MDQMETWGDILAKAIGNAAACKDSGFRFTILT